MFLYSLSMNAGDLKVARNHLATKFRDISRSHLAEALASSLGFNTSIALQTAIASNPPHEKRYQLMNVRKFVTRLHELGHMVDNSENYPLFMDMRFPKPVSLPFAIASQGIVRIASIPKKDDPKKVVYVPNRTQVEACKFVLSQVKVVRKTPCKDKNSYWHKHRVEEALGLYISNGAFIQAAVELGFKMEPEQTLNVHLYVGKKVFLAAIQDALAHGAKAAVQHLMHDDVSESVALG